MLTRSVLLVASLLAVGMASATPAPAAGVDGVPAFGHVFLIVGENTSFRQVSPRNAPYLTGTVIPNGAWLTNYHALTDGSLGDYAALTTGAVGRFDMVIPNDCENGHDLCGTHNSVRQFDDFLAREVPKIQASPAFGSDGLIVVVWDEGSDADPLHVGAALLGPQVKPSRSAAKLNHYSLLRTLEDGFGIRRHLAHAARAHAFTGIWR